MVVVVVEEEEKEEEEEDEEGERGVIDSLHVCMVGERAMERTSGSPKRKTFNQHKKTRGP
jgi:hypothetical protein